MMNHLRVVACVVLVLATGLFMQVYKLSYRYGEYGMMKKVAARQIPQRIILSSRWIFVGLKKRKIQQ